VISYEELLDIYWNAHSPTRLGSSRQYMAFIFYHNEEQRLIAQKSLETLSEKLNAEIVTQIVQFGEFTLAEDYHQKYSLQGRSDLMQEFESVYPDFKDIIDSTAAARVNGHLAGYESTSSAESGPVASFCLR
jgi:peptide-methionine (S)-S-oxide reductase